MSARMRQHLSQCNKYLSLHKAKGIENTITPRAAMQDSMQTRLNVTKPKSETKNLVDLDFAEAC